MKLYKIGEIAELLGVTTQALRYYEQHQVIQPVKSENGTRFYTAYDVHRLMAFKKYRSMDFSMLDIIDYMRNRPLDVRSQWLKEKSEALLRQSEELYRRAQALNYYREHVEKTESAADVFIERMRPDCVIQTAYWDQIGNLAPDTLREIQAYMDAMPVSALCFTTDDPHITAPRYRFCAEYEWALQWKLPLTNTLRLFPGRCASVCIICPSDFQVQPALAQAAEKAKELGFALDHQQQILCVLGTADTSTPVYRTFIRVYFPLC